MHLIKFGRDGKNPRRIQDGRECPKNELSMLVCRHIATGSKIIGVKLIVIDDFLYRKTWIGVINIVAKHVLYDIIERIHDNCE